MHVAGSQNTAAGFLSRLLQKKVQLKLRDDILTSPIEVYLQSSDVADEEELFFLPDEEKEPEQKFLPGKHYANNVPRKNTKVTYQQGNRSHQNTNQLNSLLVRRNQRKRMDQERTRCGSPP